MHKKIVRFSVAMIAIYYIVCSFVKTFMDCSIYSHNYVLGLEFALCLLTFNQGIYHCRYMRILSVSILFWDLLKSLNLKMNIFTEQTADKLSFIAGIELSIVLIIAFIHFLNKYINDRRKNQNNQVPYDKDSSNYAL